MSVRLQSGDKSNYRLEPKPRGQGGYAHVFAATHKPSGELVAFKRLFNQFGDAVDRMRREIDVMRRLAGTAGVMPILDADENNHWYVMPLADGDLSELRAGLSPTELVEVAGQVCLGLDAAHRAGFVHRDVTPRNILRLASGEWVVADWGVVRRPLGMTTRRVTEIDKPVGTDGFIAPEVLRDSHANASSAGDVFSLGQVMSWAITGRWPLAGERRAPDGPWRSWVRDALREDPSVRPTLPQLVERLEEVGYEPPEQAPERAQELADAARGGDTAAGKRLLDLADSNLDDAEIFFDYLPAVRGRALDELVVDEDMTDRLVAAMASWLEDGSAWGRRNFDDYNWVIAWLHEVALAAQRQRRFGVLEDVAERLFAVGHRLDRWRDRERTQKWLVKLRGQEAEAVARALRRSPEAVEWLRRDWDPRLDDRSISDALGQSGARIG